MKIAPRLSVLYGIIIFGIVLALGCLISPGENFGNHLIDSFALTLLAAGGVFAFAALIV
jgi:hypothetical protein